MLKTRWSELMPYIAAKGLGSLGAARFGFCAEYSELQDPLHTLVDTMSFCRIVKIGDDYSEDIKAAVTKLDLKSLGMTRNGFTLWDPKRGVGL